MKFSILAVTLLPILNLGSVCATSLSEILGSEIEKVSPQGIEGCKFQGNITLFREIGREGFYWMLNPSDLTTSEIKGFELIGSYETFDQLPFLSGYLMYRDGGSLEKLSSVYLIRKINLSSSTHRDEIVVSRSGTAPLEEMPLTVEFWRWESGLSSPVLEESFSAFDETAVAKISSVKLAGSDAFQIGVLSPEGKKLHLQVHEENVAGNFIRTLGSFEISDSKVFKHLSSNSDGRDVFTLFEKVDGNYNPIARKTLKVAANSSVTFNFFENSLFHPHDNIQIIGANFPTFHETRILINGEAQLIVENQSAFKENFDLFASNSVPGLNSLTVESRNPNSKSYKRLKEITYYYKHKP